MLRAHRHLIMRRVLIMKERSLSLPQPDPLQFMILFGFCSAEHAISTTSTYTIHFALVPSRLSRLVRSTLFSNVPSRASFLQNRPHHDERCQVQAGYHHLHPTFELLVSPLNSLSLSLSTLSLSSSPFSLSLSPGSAARSTPIHDLIWFLFTSQEE